MRARVLPARATLLAAVIATGACHPSPADHAAAGADEQQQLNAAAASLDAEGNAVAGNADTYPDANTEDQR